MTTQRIDALAVMDRQIQAVAYDVADYQATTASLADLREARAAVAELIEADRDYDAVLSEPAGATRDETWGGRYKAAWERRRAALARVGGA